jgi:hypothetical protein
MFERQNLNLPNMDDQQRGASHESVLSFEKPLSPDQSHAEYMVRYAERVACELTPEECDDLPLSKQIDGLALNDFGGTATGNWINQLYSAPMNFPHIEEMFAVLNASKDLKASSCSQEKRGRTMKILETAMGSSIQGIPENPEKSFFENTNFSRPFIKSGYGSNSLGVDDSSMCRVLFGIPAFQFELIGQQIAGAQQYIKSKVNGKKIALFGGGSSVIDLVYNNKDFHPANIIKIDPHVIRADGFTSTPNPYVRIEMSAGDPDLQESMKKLEAPQVDEIWATFSVPYYCSNAEEIARVFENAKKLLAPGGTLRIFPYDMPMIGMHDAMHKSGHVGEDSITKIMNLNDARQKAYVESVKSFNSDPEFNVSLINVSGIPGRATLLIQRIG